MDTRIKIVDVDSLDTSGMKTLIGYFDPLHAGHIRRLKELSPNGQRLVVVVADPADPILPTRARAELVAALECVAYVLPVGGQDEDAITAAFPWALDEREADENRTREFAQHVHARHNAK